MDGKTSMNETKRLAFRRGLLVFLGLVVLSAIEFTIGLIGVTGGVLLVAMVLIILMKAGLVVWFYMHIRHFFSAVTGGEE